MDSFLLEELLCYQIFLPQFSLRENSANCISFRLTKCWQWCAVRKIARLAVQVSLASLSVSAKLDNRRQMKCGHRAGRLPPHQFLCRLGTISCYNSLHIYFRRSGGCSESGKKGRGRNRNKSLRSGKLNRRGIFAFSDFRSKPRTRSHAGYCASVWVAAHWHY